MSQQANRRKRVDCFPDGHPGYADWLVEHPTGYVLAFRSPEQPAILHRADCPHVSSLGQRSPGPGQCEKRCARKRETVEEWIVNRRDQNGFRPCAACVAAFRATSMYRLVTRADIPLEQRNQSRTIHRVMGK